MLSIIGCGNPNRQDDGVGVHVVQRLMESTKDLHAENIRIFDAGTSGMDVMFQARGSDSLIIIDANQSGSKAGSIFQVPGEELENVPEPSYNLHDFRWDHALYAGRKIYKEDFPTDITVFLIEAESLDLGTELTQSVEQASNRVVELVLERIGTYLSKK